MRCRPSLAIILEFGELNRLVHRLLDRVHIGGVRFATDRVARNLIGRRGIGNRNGAVRSLPALCAVAGVQIRTDLERVFEKILINHFDRFASSFHHLSGKRDLF